MNNTKVRVTVVELELKSNKGMLLMPELGDGFYAVGFGPTKKKAMVAAVLSAEKITELLKNEESAQNALTLGTKY